MSTPAIALRLYEAYLRYPPGQEVHTAASGRIDALHELYLEIEDRESGLVGVGEVRANAAFITGTPEHEAAPGVIRLCRQLARSDPDALAQSFTQAAETAPKICRALVDIALADLSARRSGVPLAGHLGGAWRSDGLACNNCVFWGDRAALDVNLAQYAAQGFRKIKLRVGIGSIEEDAARLARIRERYGSALILSIDANGAWTAEQALGAIDRLRRFDLEYVEQPTTAGDWPAIERVARDCGLPVLIDEGLQDAADIARLCANEGRIGAHLKICKAGGVSPIVEIGRRLNQDGVAYVMGQMNEGAIATAAAIHAGMALRPRIGELYGALGLINDAADGVRYADGRVFTPHGPGLGMTLNKARVGLLWRSDEEP